MGYTDDAIAHHGVVEAGMELLHKLFNPETLARRVRMVLETQVLRETHHDILLKSLLSFRTS